MNSQNFQPKLNKPSLVIPELFQCLKFVGSPFRKPKKRKYRVKFASTRRLVLIPTRKEYQDANLASSLWHSPAELARIERDGLSALSTGRLHEDSDELCAFIPRAVPSV
jgi:hypothetical protein